MLVCLPLLTWSCVVDAEWPRDPVLAMIRVESCITN